MAPERGSAHKGHAAHSTEYPSRENYVKRDVHIDLRSEDVQYVAHINFHTATCISDKNVRAPLDEVAQRA